MVIVENFFVLLGCTFPVLWLETSFSGAFLVSLAFLRCQLLQHPAWDM